VKSEDKTRQIKVVQRIADGFALEMTNVLAAVIGRASVLEAEMDSDSPMYSDVEAILSAGRLALDLTRSLLDFSQQQPFAQDRVSLNEVVGKVAALWERSVEQPVEIQLKLDGELHEIVGDSSRIRQMLVQLGVNAIDAMPSGGVLTFTTQNVRIEKDEPAASSFSGLGLGDYVRLQVSDSGEGMDPETVQQAFEPFFSTKHTAASTGLGLAQVYDTVKRHGGEVSLFSKKGLGTTATVYFPAVVAHEGRRPGHGETKRAPNAKGTVLLVDDDLHVLRTGQRLVEKLGFHVLPAVDGAEAVECFQSRRDEIAVVIVDLIMPLTDGTEVLRLIRELDPEARVIICSGYMNENARREALELGADEFLTKPYTLDTLSATIDRALATQR
jgi:CheY-like chemotaxis protein